MKKIFIKFYLIGLVLLVAFSCEDKLEEYYTNPNETTEGSLAMLFSGMLNNARVVPTYSDYSTYKLGTPGKYTGMVGLAYGTNMYNFNTTYTGNRWNDYYDGNMMNSYRSMEKIYNEMSEDEQESEFIFLLLAKIVLFDQSAQMVDVWGDIPWTEAGSLNSTNTLINPSYDDAESIYTTIIDSLDAINTYFMNMDDLESGTQTSLANQDLLNEGDLDQWRIYANSLRLRLLMRISNYDEATAQTAVTAMLADATTYPLVESNDGNIQVSMAPSQVSLYSDLKSALTDGAASEAPYGPQYMIETIMKGNNDPRTDVFWDAGDTVDVDNNHVFVGISQENTSDEVNSLSNVLATYDSATFIYNWNVPGVLFTAAEISFLRAEAYQRWGLGDAKTAYETGIQQSIDFYYDINQNAYLNTNYTWSRDVMDSPSADDIATYLADEDIAYSGSSDELMEKIITQKWIHFFILQAGEAWAEYRRTGYPTLEFVEYSLGNGLSQPPLRVTYPTSESAYNAANYAEVADYDDSSNPIFWDVD